MSFPATPLRPDQSPEVLRLLQEVQGNVLSPHRRDFSAHLFLKIPPGKETAIQGWLQSLAANGSITSMERQLQGLPPDQPFLSVMVSYEGAKKMGWGGTAAFRNDFLVGMHDHEETFVFDPNDPAVKGVKEWDLVFRKDLTGRVDVHLMFAVTEGAGLPALVQTFADRAAALGADPCATHFGYVARNPQGYAIEHFGFADGISNPQYLADDVQRAYRHSGFRQYWDPVFPLDSVLVSVPGRDGAASYGSFFVYRKIEQHVAAFREFERQARLLTSRYGTVEPESLVVGRTKEGRPLAVPERNVPAGEPFNDFTYGDDQPGRRCPFHAHIRKSNARRLVPIDNDEARNHLFPRRGMLYGERQAAFADAPAGDVGLLFMAYMHSLEHQFEHMLRNWINNPKFPAQERPGVDSLIGEPPACSVRLPVSEYDDVEVELSRFVTTRGGEYFFVPPISWFLTLPATSQP